MDIANKIGFGMLGAALLYVAGMVTGLEIKHYQIRNGSVYSADLDKDGLNDLVMRDSVGFQFMYLGQENGTYKGVPKVRKEQTESNKKSFEERLKEIEENAKKIGIE